MVSIEKWKEILKGKIPKDQYEMALQSGEAEGLIIKLISRKYHISLDFGVVSAFKVLDEGIALNGLFSDEQIGRFRDTGFDNVIYQITEGSFGESIQQISGDLYNYLNLKHYVVITENYIVEIITKWEPDIIFC